jgi:endogenous inhibitor of DNA gyrase (YacG/DUF329 family)
MLLRCPQCTRQLEVPDNWGPRPFCSSRCKQADLHGWFTEAYVISTPIDADSLEDYVAAVEESGEQSPPRSRRN